MCYDCLKRAPNEVKQSSSFCQTRMRCACVSKLACMRVWNTFDPGKWSFRAFFYYASVGPRHARINLSLSKKWCFRGSQTRTRNACVSDSMMKFVLLRWTPSLNYSSVEMLTRRSSGIDWFINIKQLADFSAISPGFIHGHVNYTRPPQGSPPRQGLKWGWTNKLQEKLSVRPRKK